MGFETPREVENNNHKETAAEKFKREQILEKRLAKEREKLSKENFTRKTSQQ